ncbi:phosphatidylserine decarboxylase [Mycena maculata]|uniref:Phosphatidylserine decarboxylase n=1 Tax=Mycena maculata TaxID=230809 RepID=A0AAD7HVH8_9AGAR|nr:phosphatidylserine decarboxylase [Mycena maculata]
MCLMAVGMTDVSTCEMTVKESGHIVCGDELGMFHFGGSTHVLIFRLETKPRYF